MDIPDAFVINKCDEERLARRSQHELRAALDLARVEHAGVPHQIFQTSALSGRGVPELATYLRTATNAPPAVSALRAKEAHFLRRTVAERYGAFGVGIAAPWLEAAGEVESYEQRERAIFEAIALRIR